MSNGQDKYTGPERRGPTKVRNTAKDALSIIAAIVAACSLTFAITTGTFAARLTTVENKVSVLETTVAAIKAEFGTKLDLLIKNMDKLEQTLQVHMNGGKL